MITRISIVFFALSLAPPALGADSAGNGVANAKVKCVMLGDTLARDAHRYREPDLEHAIGRLKRARKACEAALQASPKDARVMQYLGMLRLADRDDSGATLLQKAANTGDGEAMRGYAAAILAGNVPGKEIAEGVRFMESAAQAGNMQAQAELGLVLARGSYGVPRDTERALRLLRRYGRRGNPQAHFALALIFLTTNPVAADDPDGLADRDLARHYLDKASRAGLPEAQAMFGQLLLKNARTKAERERARDLIMAAANAGSQRAAYFLGTLYSMGYTVPEDQAKARHWYCRGGPDGVALAAVEFGEDSCLDIGPESYLNP